MNRTQRANLAKDTLAIVERGSYVAPSGRTVDLRPQVQAMLDGTVVYSPDELPPLAKGDVSPADRLTRFEVTPETTLAAARRLFDEGHSTLALNFASAKNPGGGFLSGSQAQEESLARSSALYESQLRGRAMYDANRVAGTCLYTEHIIYSPRVPFFREDAGGLLEAPFFVSILTAPAVNAGALRDAERPLLEPTMLHRAERVLEVASRRGYSTVVLGAWGCGVFRNDPQRVAGWFASHLLGSGSRAKAFDRVVFAIYDPSTDRPAFEAFRRVFDEPTG
jgi:uncharacterized protein (TIGR02452 family)